MAKESRYCSKPMRKIPPVTTVGELKALLDRLPDDLPLALFDDGYKPVWFNIGDKTEHLSLMPNDGTMDDQGTGE